MFTALFARQHEKVSPCLEEVAEPAGWKLRVWTANTDEAEEGVWRDRYSLWSFSLWSFCRFGLLCAPTDQVFKGRHLRSPPVPAWRLTYRLVGGATVENGH